MRYENPIQNRVEWPLSARNGKTRRRRPSSSTRVAGYHNTSRSPRFTPGTSPKFESPPPHHQHTFQPSPGQVSEFQFLDFYDIQGPAEANPGSELPNNGLGHSNWFPSSPGPHILGSHAPDLAFDEHQFNPSSTHPPFPLSEGSLDMSWTDVNSMRENVSTDRDNTPLSEVQAGSFQGANNVPFMTPENVLPSNTDQYGFAGMGNIFEFSPSEDGQFFTSQQFRNVSSPPLGSPADAFLFEDHTFTDAATLDYGNVYAPPSNWTSMVPVTPQQNHPRADHASHTRNSPPAPFSYQPAPITGDVTVPPQRTQSYGMQLSEEYLKPRLMDPASPMGDGASDGWVVTSGPSSSYALSHHSPYSHGSPASHNSPVRAEGHQHSHIFDADARISKPKGRQRSLTTKEKKDAREVRDAKACWACHISKTKCSPCSPGRPCAQCDRLVGKRRFCKFDCFNDPLESLFTFMVPEYNMLQFTEGKVTALLSEVGWGTQKLRVRLSWGYYRTLEADVVGLTLRHNIGSLGFQHHAIANGANRPLLMRKPSPPLGITQESMAIIGDTYSAYVEDIINNDLWGYVTSGAYDEDDSDFSKRLLWTVSSYYLRGLQADEECTLLKKAIEMHITSTILERSLILDPNSIEQVQSYLRQSYPARSAPRCAQRQIKLTFFTLQRERIVSILKEWGAMMWTIHNAANHNEKWAIGFSTFIMLTLVIDKTLGSAYYLCESRIEHRGADAEAERREFRELINLTETKLFSRCKEIFHWKFKTRKAGKEACNPIRDGMEAFKGRPVSDGITHLVGDLQSLTRDFDREIREHRTLPRSSSAEAPYTDVVRLACIFLDDFLEHI